MMRLFVLLPLWLIGFCATAQTSSQIYAEQCREAVGELPEFSCADGVEVPITVNGMRVSHYSRGMTCDRPALLDNGPGSDGQCVPYSRILDLSTETMQVTVMCRQKIIRPAASLDYDEIDVIAHNPATGATCWFQAKGNGRESPVNGAMVSSPTEAIDASYWAEPEAVKQDGCGNCHDNDPFMYSPFVGQVWGHVPVNPFGAYYHVGARFGFDDWPTMAMDLRDNTCLGCHRIGTKETCGQLTEWATGSKIPKGANSNAASYPLNHSMSPDHDLELAAWNTIHQENVNDILSCCANDRQPKCQLTGIPKYRQ